MAEMAAIASATQHTSGSTDALSSVGYPADHATPNVPPSSCTLGRPFHRQTAPSREVSLSLAERLASYQSESAHGFAHLSSHSQFHWQSGGGGGERSRSLARLSNPSGYYTTGRPGLRYCAIPTVPKTNSSLKVSLPPENGSPPSSLESAPCSYGAIPTLEASPRRIRYKNLSGPVQYEPGGTKLRLPSASSTGSSGNVDSPPKLPQKPSRVASASPPPLPPKKPLSMPQGSSLLQISPANQSIDSNASSHHESEPYDFPGEADQPKRYGHLDEIKQAGETVELEFLRELSKMSVLELGQKISQGELPPELKGMTISEIMDYVSKKLYSNPNPAQAAELSLMKPSFSDNFVSSNVVGTPLSNPHLKKVEQESISSMSPGPPSAKTDAEFEFSGSEFLRPSSSPSPKPIVTEEDILKKLQSMQTSTSSAASVPPNPPAAAGSITSSEAGFEDDFSGVEVQGKSGQESQKEDRYAVLRELQLEDDLIRAWKSPSDEDVKGEEEEDGEEEAESEVKEEMADAQSREDADDEEEDSYKPRVCSSEGSPCSRSDSGNSRKSASEDQASLQDESEDRTRPSEEPEMEESTAAPASRNVAADNFESTFGPANDVLVATKSGNWATFDEGPTESSRRLKMTHHRIHQEDGFDSEKELSRYHKQPYISSPRGVVSSQDVPYNGGRGWSDHRRESQASKESLDANPFGHDTFTPPIMSSDNLGRSVSVTPPVFEGEVQRGRLRDNNSEYSDSFSMQSGEGNLDTKPDEENGNVEEDIFQAATLLDESGFKVHAARVLNKGSEGDIPKSDSINIFSVKDDPFDDDFFRQ